MNGQEKVKNIKLMSQKKKKGGYLDHAKHKHQISFPFFPRLFMVYLFSLISLEL